MTSLERQIRRSIDDSTWIVSVHAARRLKQRRIAAWQVAVASGSGETTSVHPAALPNATVHIVGTLADGTPVDAVWAWLPITAQARLVTVFEDR